MNASDARSAEGRGELNRPQVSAARLLEVTDLEKHFPLKGGFLGSTTYIECFLQNS